MTLLSVVTEVITDRKCFTRREWCNSTKQKPPCALEEAEGISLCSQSTCKFRSIDAFCDGVNILDTACPILIGNRKVEVYCKEKDPEEPATVPAPPPTPQTSSGDNKTTVIVIAVCVSVVVLIIAALIAGIYCWRVRRNQERQRSAIDVEKRENDVTNNDFRSEIGSPRRDSTYNTITDLDREPSYHSLKKQNPTGAEGYNRLGDVTDDREVEPYQVGKVSALPNEEGEEYNRINLKKSPASNFDPSYDHLRSFDSDSDYNSTSDVTCKSSSAYNYGVPIRMKVLEGHDLHVTVAMGSTNDESANVESNETGRTTHSEGGDDDYVIPKDGLPDLRHSDGDKPKAIVSPMITTKEPNQALNVKDSDGRQNVKIERKVTYNDDYELATAIGTCNTDVKMKQNDADPNKSVTIKDFQEFGNDGKALNIRDSGEGQHVKIPKKVTYNDDYELATAIGTHNTGDKMKTNDADPNTEEIIEDRNDSRTVKSENGDSYEEALVCVPTKKVENCYTGLEPKSSCEEHTDEGQMKPASDGDYEVAVITPTRQEVICEQMGESKERVDMVKGNSVGVKSGIRNDYEEAVTGTRNDNDIVIGNVSKIELPTRVTVGYTSTKPLGDDGYELAVVNNVERL